MRYLVSATLLWLVALGLVLPWPGAPAEGAIPGEPDPGVPAVIPEEASQRQNPVPASKESIADGLGLFSSQCSMCHGVNGNGGGDLAVKLELRMPDFTHAARQAGKTDGDLFYILTHGHGHMPGETRLSEKSRWDLVNAIRTMTNKNP